MDNLMQKLQAHGLKGKALQTAWLIMQRESKGNPNAYNPDAGTGDKSYGLFQINMLGNLGPARRKQYGLTSNSQLFNPDTNIEAAKKLSKNWTDFGAWGVGPNAYRQTAALDYSKFPMGQVKDTAVRLGERRRREDSSPSSPTFGADSSTSGLASQRLAAGEFFRNRAMARINDQPLPGLMAFATQMRQLRQTSGMHVPEISDGNDTDNRGENPSAARPKGNYLDTSAGWTPTHVTDGLDWNDGKKTAADIMAAAGTQVGAPEPGTVVRWGSAQGGEALYYKGQSGKMYWLGHIDNRLPVGTKALEDQIIARISPKHANPHLHIDSRVGGWKF